MAAVIDAPGGSAYTAKRESRETGESKDIGREINREMSREISTTRKMCTAQWGQLGFLTSQQEETLSKFKREADPSYVETAKYTVEAYDQCCLRFLRARQVDLEKSLTLLSECFQKKTDMKASYWAKLTPDECANCDIAALKNFYPHTQRGFDKQNRPIFFEHTGGDS